MWVNSKTAAAVFCVNHKSVEKSAFRATKQGKNFCSLKSHICNFMYSNGIGRGGKVLQIWIDDSVIAEFENKRSAFSQSEKCFLENKRSGDTHEVRGVFLAEQSEAEQSQNGVRVSQNGIIQGSKCADLHGILGEIPQESQNLANLPYASFNNGSLNTGDCFVSCDTRNDNRDGSVGVSADSVSGAVGVSGLVGGMSAGGANLQGRGGDFANLHNENLGGCSVSTGSFGSAISGATNEVSSKKPKQAKRWRTK